ncbi:MAG: isochorismate synthase [Lentimicrobium sp.]|jgi:isochorismate synthase|nr:isochorismate synthase [Lentimicrobium sp.]
MNKLNASFVELEQLQDFLINNGVPFASCRQPGESSPVTLISSGEFEQHSTLNETIEKGRIFLMAPFYPEAEICSFVPEFELHGYTFDPFTLKVNQNETRLPDHEGKTIDAITYQNKIAHIIQQIQQGQADKIVISRSIKTQKLQPHDSTALFKLLCQLHPQAYVYLAFFPGKGLWAGASPELLLRADSGGIETIALAGTRKAGTTAAWGAKEIDEQSWVSKHVLECLTNSGCQHIQVSETETINAGNASHLMTSFNAHIQKNSLPSLIEMLHPTPAVCGWPREKAMQIIRETENYDRDFYAGYVGTFDKQGNAALYVNLRCLQIFNNTTVIYAGGGITAGSDPLAEWEETELKSRNMLCAIEKIRNLATSSENQRNEQ